MKFEGAYLSDGWADSAQICNGNCPTPRVFSHQKMVNFGSGTMELQMRENGVFLVAVKYKLVCPARTGCTWPHDIIIIIII